MRCRTAQYAIHLDGEDECPPRLRRRALAHAAECAECGEELRRVEASAGRLAGIRNAVPRLSDPSGLAAAIMREVERPRMRERQPSLIDSILPGSRFRILLQSAGWTIAVLFAGQTLLDAAAMSKLDERFDRRAAERVRQPERGGYPLVADERVAQRFSAVGQAEFESLLGFLRTPPSPSRELEQLLAKYPGLAKIDLSDGLDDTERHVLLTQGPELVKDLKQLIMHGRNRQ